MAGKDDFDDLDDFNTLLQGFDLDTSFGSDFLLAEHVSKTFLGSDSDDDWIKHPIASVEDSSRGLSLLSSDLYEERGYVAKGSSNLTEESIAQEAKHFTSEIRQVSCCRVSDSQTFMSQHDSDQYLAERCRDLPSHGIVPAISALPNPHDFTG